MQYIIIMLITCPAVCSMFSNITSEPHHIKTCPCMDLRHCHFNSPPSFGMTLTLTPGFYCRLYTMARVRGVSPRFDHDFMQFTIWLVWNDEVMLQKYLIFFRPSGGLVLRKAFKPRGHSSHTRPPCGTRLLNNHDLKSKPYQKKDWWITVHRTFFIYHFDWLPIFYIPRDLPRIAQSWTACIFCSKIPGPSMPRGRPIIVWCRGGCVFAQSFLSPPGDIAWYYLTPPPPKKNPYERAPWKDGAMRIVMKWSTPKLHKVLWKKYIITAFCVQQLFCIMQHFFVCKILNKKGKIHSFRACSLSIKTPH